MTAPGERAEAPRIETLLAVAALALMTALPLAEILSRKFLGRGVPGSAPVVQHLTLCVAFLGAALAARANRLLALSTVSFLPASARRWVRLFTSALTVAVTSTLAWASLGVVGAEREAGTELVLGFPTWPVVAVMPVGLAAVVWRVMRNASASWAGRLAAGSGVLVPLLLGFGNWLPPERVVTPGTLVLLAATLLGLPIFAALGGLALLFFWG
jgi:C4-dicarboxylate transporter DctM subunit